MLVKDVSEAREYRQTHGVAGDTLYNRGFLVLLISMLSIYCLELYIRIGILHLDKSAQHFLYTRSAS